MTPTATAAATSPGSFAFPSVQPAGMMLGPLSPPWIEAVPPWNAAVSPPVDAVLSPVPGAPVAPPADGIPYSSDVIAPPPGGVAPPVTVPAGTAGPLATVLDRPGRSSGAPGHAASPGRSPVPPRERSAPPDRAQAFLTPRASPQAPPPRRPAPSRHADTPPPARGRGLPNPCATMHDFRRQPCEQVLDSLTR
ncbi:hypothetical protein [Nonomuraea sp. GTA35]|uniref:hypothetical protein n=1 Tax=Nonomuraea sp. GTA35 TaxID=1676746 RepID=UPI0035C1B3DB